MQEESYAPQTKQQLADAYGVSLRTINNWLEPYTKAIGIKTGRTYTPKQVKVIYDCLGSPDLVKGKSE